MKAVLINASPYSCEKIAQGAKCLLRQAKPNLKPPFKCYLYETQGKRYNFNVRVDTIAKNHEDRYLDCMRGAPEVKRTKKGEPYFSYGRMAVVGEFICKSIEDYTEAPEFTVMPESDLYKHISVNACIKGYNEVESLVRSGMAKYGLCVSDFVAYDEPKPLSEFYSLCGEWEKGEFTKKCHRCKHFVRNDKDFCHECAIEGEYKISTPPKTYAYVEELT